MGIPRFFAFLAKNYPQVIAKMLKQPANSYIEGLYIDLNSPIHTIAQRLFKYGLDRIRKYGLTPDEQRLQSEFSQMDQQSLQKVLFDNIGSYLIYCYLKLKPKKYFMIAVDGVAPKAKMVQQRLRRFKSNGPATPFFDPVVISPGTRFMDDLDKYLTETWPAEYKHVLEDGLTLIYSGHREPGEGEHKIFEQIDDAGQGQVRAKYLGQFREGRLMPYQVILGADSDLIVLSLAKNKNIIFMKHQDQDFRDMANPDLIEHVIDYKLRPPCDLNQRNRQFAVNQKWTDMFDNGFQWLDVTSMRNHILEEFITPNEIVDFSLISFFVGNDFLPPIPDLEVVTTTSPIYYSDEMIQARYPDVNPRRFWETFKNLEETWKFNDRGFPMGRGLLNKQLNQYEMFPYQHELLTGRKVRIMATQQKGSNKWIIDKRDSGNLMGCLAIYSKLMQQKRMSRRGGSNTYLVESKSKINYINLLEYLKELIMWSEIFVAGHASQFAELERRKESGNNVSGDPLIKMSLGNMEIGKRVVGKVLVPATFSNLNSYRNFGIYDSEYADPKLPKRSDDMCRHWLEGAAWTLRYYSEGLKSVNTQWFYPYQSSPTIYEMITYLESRLIVEIPSYPGIGYSLSSDTVEVERINVDGMVYRNDMGSIAVNNGIKGHLAIYIDTRGKQICMLTLESGEQKFVDFYSLDFVKPIRKITMGSGLLKPESTYSDINPSKVTLIETFRTKLTIDIRRTFPLADQIERVISDIGYPYASVVESFFSIMPVRVLKSIMSPGIVDIVVGQISDAFPDGFEEVTEGKYYEGGGTIKIPFLSPTRLRRALDEIPEEFNLEIDRLNTIKPRYQIMLRGTLKSVGQIVLVELKGSSYQGGKESNIASNTTRRQKQ